MAEPIVEENPAAATTSSPAAPRDAIAWDRWFVVLALVFGVALLLALPPFTTPDEPSHVLRVATMADGWIVPPRTTESPPDYQIDGCVNALVLRPQPTPGAPWSARFENPPCGRSDPARAGLGVIRRSEIYTLVPYAPALVGFRLGAVGGATGSLYGARVVQLLAYVTLVWAAIRLVPRGKPLLFATALLPVALQSAVGVSADPITIAIAFLAIALTLRLTDRARLLGPRASTWSLVAVGSAFVALGLAKSAYLPLTVLLCTIPTGAFGSMRRRLGWLAGIATAVVVTTGGWIVGVVSHLQASPDANFDSAAESQWVLRHPLDFLAWVGRSWSDGREVAVIAKGIVVPIYRFVVRPEIATPLLVVVALALVAIRLLDPPPGWWRPPRPDGPVAGDDLGATATPAIARSERIVAVVCVVAAAAGTLLLIEYGLVITGNVVGRELITGFQGRYLIPLIPLSLFGVELSRARRVPTRALAWIPVASGALLLWWLVVTLRHYDGWF